MAEATLAVFSDDADYVSRFLAYFRKKESAGFGVAGFTAVQTLDDYLAGRAVDILLVSKKSLTPRGGSGKKDPGARGLEEMLEHSKNAGKIVYLGERQRLDAEPFELDMYRSMRLISADIHNLARRLHSEEGEGEGAADIYGIYVLDAARGEERFLRPEEWGAICRGRPLYIDPDCFSPLRIQGKAEGRPTLSDVIYGYMTDSDSFAKTVSDALFEAGETETLLPPISGGDLKEIPARSLADFFSKTAAAANCACVVLNITPCCPNLTDLFGVCKKIFLFTRFFDAAARGQDLSDSDSPAAFRAKSMHNYFAERGREDILMKMEDGFKTFGKEAHPPREAGTGLKAKGRLRDALR